LDGFNRRDLNPSNPLLDWCNRTSPEGERETQNLLPHKKREDFLKKITRQSSRLLTVPSCDLGLPPPATKFSAPRTSRRVAGVGVEFNMQDLGSKATKNVMRSLHIISDNEGISQEALHEYVSLFKQPLSPCHVEALSALFGWSTPDGIC
jgi:hypothetical protein